MSLRPFSYLDGQTDNLLTCGDEADFFLKNFLFEGSTFSIDVLFWVSFHEVCRAVPSVSFEHDLVGMYHFGDCAARNNDDSAIVNMVC